MAFNLHKKIMVKTSFRGTHNWPEASMYAGQEVDFLEDRHRHTFHVQGELEVSDSDREVEFFVFQKILDDSIRELYSHEGLVFNLGRRSCETIAEEIIEKIRERLNYKGIVVVQVWEDGEVGASVASTPAEDLGTKEYSSDLFHGLKTLLKSIKKN